MFTVHHWELAQSGDTKARNAVMVEYQNLIDYCAGSLSKKLPKHVDFNDLRAAGQFGLMDAIDKYDPHKGFKFETYAISRIRGSMIDELRSLDWVPRSIRFRERQVSSTIEKMTLTLGREPTLAEIADDLDIDEEELQDIINESDLNYIWNLDAPVDEENGQTLGELLVCDIQMVDQEVSSVNVDAILDAIDSLQQKEKATINLHYYLGYTLAEIGRRFDVTESRVCQIHTKALEHIRKALIDD